MTMRTEGDLGSIVEHHGQKKSGVGRVLVALGAFSLLGFGQYFSIRSHTQYDYHYCQNLLENGSRTLGSPLAYDLIGPKTGNTCDFILKNYKPSE